MPRNQRGSARAGGLEPEAVTPLRYKGTTKSCVCTQDLRRREDGATCHARGGTTLDTYSAQRWRRARTHGPARTTTSTSIDAVTTAHGGSYSTRLKPPETGSLYRNWFAVGNTLFISVTQHTRQCYTGHKVLHTQPARFEPRSECPWGSCATPGSSLRVLVRLAKLRSASTSRGRPNKAIRLIAPPKMPSTVASELWRQL